MPRADLAVELFDDGMAVPRGFTAPHVVDLETLPPTERPEACEAGCAMLVGTDAERIYAEAERLLTDEAHYRKMAQAKNPFGDGKAGERIVQVLADALA